MRRILLIGVCRFYDKLAIRQQPGADHERVGIALGSRQARHAACARSCPEGLSAKEAIGHYVLHPPRMWDQTFAGKHLWRTDLGQGAIHFG
jgi:hypothetical protein